MNFRSGVASVSLLVILLMVSNSWEVPSNAQPVPATQPTTSPTSQPTTRAATQASTGPVIGNREVQFIRLKHAGVGWDDGMGEAGADRNFLQRLHEVSGFEVREDGDAIEIGLLKAYKKGRAPAFVYLTGNAAIEGVTEEDVKTLRQYVDEGGMIFVDCGSPKFDKSFRVFIRDLFPDRALRDIANDDDIFKEPFTFPNGAPPLWHHGGTRSLGVRMDDGRLGVFYFPGDLNDALKTGAGASPNAVDQAYKLGLNVLYYAFTHYAERYPQAPPNGARNDK